MSSTTTLGQSKETEISENSTTLFVAVMGKDVQKDVKKDQDKDPQKSSFPCYWFLLKRLKEDADAFQAVTADDLAEKLKEVLAKILIDPLFETLWGANLDALESWRDSLRENEFNTVAIKQFLPGVTDNLARVVEEALETENLPYGIQVASGHIYLSKEPASTFDRAPNQLYHPIVERLSVLDLNEPTWSVDFPGFPNVQLTESSTAVPVDINVRDIELEEISRTRLLALNLKEMQAIQAYFSRASVKQERAKRGLPPTPTDVELEIIAQTWSEHCKHKIFNAVIDYADHSATGTLKERRIQGLYKTYIQGATRALKSKRKDLLSVFCDNSGVVQWDENYAICFKVETHNSPSALEPYGGALTGILGVNRDILGTGLGARPIFNTNVLCFAHPSDDLVQRPKLLPAEAIINGVRQGIQDGGNKSGIPTVNGAIVFHAGYRAKPLVFCGTGGLLPLELNDRDGYGKYTKAGDTIVMAGGRVGKDGIHGATFSSEALHEESPVSAVQIGDPFTQKRLSDFVLEARDLNLITGITDNGAGGLSSSVGEMAELTGGATIEIDHVPTKYPGLSDWEIVVSESQERMTISTDNFERLKEVALKHRVEVSAIGNFSKSDKFEITRSGRLVASLDLNFLHKGVPVLHLKGEWKPFNRPSHGGVKAQDLNAILLKLLAHPNICNREVVIRQYDHEVQATSVIKPLMGAKQTAPCDAAVIQPVLGEAGALAIANGLAPRLSAVDPYVMALCAVDEAIRNLVCVGADPTTVSLLDNFCWPDPVESAQNKEGRALAGQLVRTCEGLFDAVMAFEAPLISGKDSMKNDFDDGTVRLSIPPTLLISAIARVPKADESLSMEFKHAGDLIYLLHTGTLGFAGSHYEEITERQDDSICSLDAAQSKNAYQTLHDAIRKGIVRSAHDLSDGGFATALAECIIGSGKGAHVVLKDWLKKSKESDFDFLLFAEGPGFILVSVDAGYKEDFEKLFDAKVLSRLGVVTEAPLLELRGNTENESPLISLSVSELERAWNAPLPFN
jgi:phosphoribosylformylglycinamidine synthase subunit PurSL